MRQTALRARVRLHLSAAAGPGEAFSQSRLMSMRPEAALSASPSQRGAGPSLLRPMSFVPLLRGIATLCEFNDIVKVGFL